MLYRLHNFLKPFFAFISHKETSRKFFPINLLLCLGIWRLYGEPSEFLFMPKTKQISVVQNPFSPPKLIFESPNVFGNGFKPKLQTFRFKINLDSFVI